MARVLVTGGEGFLGAPLASRAVGRARGDQRGRTAHGNAPPRRLGHRCHRRARKAFCEHLAAAMSTRADAPRYLGLRFGDVYGPGRVRGWRDVQMIVEKVAADERTIAFPDCPDAIDWTWIDDAADVLLRTIERPLPRDAVANVVGDKRRMRDAFAHLQRRFPDLVAHARPARTPPAAWGLVNDGLMELLGVIPTVTLEQGIDRTLEAARGR